MNEQISSKIETISKKYHTLVKGLIKDNYSISTMESCTGGLVASFITDVDGASSIFPGTFVTYTNDTKLYCGVAKETIEKKGVYSRACASEMAELMQEQMGTRIAIGITGTLGNVDENNNDSKKGVVYIAIALDDVTPFTYEMEELIGDNKFENKLKVAEFVVDELLHIFKYE